MEFQSVVPGPAASVSLLRNLLEMQLLGPFPAKSETWGGVQQSVFYEALQVTLNQSVKRMKYSMII